MIIDPFCQTQDCYSSHLASTIRMMRYAMRYEDESSATPSARENIRTCIAALHGPHDALTKDDVIDYARSVLMGNALPLEYGCAT